jgi:hypothetical protein
MQELFELFLHHFYCKARVLALYAKLLSFFFFLWMKNFIDQNQPKQEEILFKKELQLQTKANWEQLIFTWQNIVIIVRALEKQQLNILLFFENMIT